ncbi:hypothetical protein Q2490_03500 [Myroides odoratimimus]|uniref:hypothetical protein n=1 Tax=Myroides odoratimimus TaxID=76832 RepID=UPI001CE070F6|nr:hypothetical protein [Myroides odoratimimus]MDO5856348.1 hypothetical protein [Myroides odoratimimus]MDX4972666.1 hypothetical protein [Myroides odoratimimus]MEC4025912.1 hypothetical protein [Myroides odoratimimus]
MRKFLFIIISLLVFRPVVPLVDYLVDYDYIATFLCVNQDKPEMHCNGQCYLMQELAKIAKEEQKKDAVKQVYNIAFVLMYVDYKSELPTPNFDIKGVHKVYDRYNNLYSSLFSRQDLRPPLV